MRFERGMPTISRTRVTRMDVAAPASAQLVSRHDNFAKRSVDQLAIIKELNALVCLSGQLLSLARRTSPATPLTLVPLRRRGRLAPLSPDVLGPLVLLDPDQVHGLPLRSVHDHPHPRPGTPSIQVRLLKHGAGGRAVRATGDPHDPRDCVPPSTARVQLDRRELAAPGRGLAPAPNQGHGL